MAILFDWYEDPKPSNKQQEKTETPCIRASNTTVPQGPTYCADVFKNVVH